MGLMEPDAIAGFTIVVATVVLLIGLGLWSRSSINRIARKNLGNLREIKKQNGR